MVVRALYRDVIPYGTPSSLDLLLGPSEGVLNLPVTVRWGPDPLTDLSTAEGVGKAYENIPREGTAQQQEELLDADLLRSVWPDLRLPSRCRDLWLERFPELAVR